MEDAICTNEIMYICEESGSGVEATTTAGEFIISLAPPLLIQ
jgi:hypothetical protein